MVLFLIFFEYENIENYSIYEFYIFYFEKDNDSNCGLIHVASLEGNIVTDTHGNTHKVKEIYKNNLFIVKKIRTVLPKKRMVLSFNILFNI